MGDIFSDFVDHLGLVPKGGQSRVIGVFFWLESRECLSIKFQLAQRTGGEIDG